MRNVYGYISIRVARCRALRSVRRGLRLGRRTAADADGVSSSARTPGLRSAPEPRRTPRVLTPRGGWVVSPVATGDRPGRAPHPDTERFLALPNGAGAGQAVRPRLRQLRPGAYPKPFAVGAVSGLRGVSVSRWRDTL